MKNVLSDRLLTKHFDPSLPVQLLTDGSLSLITCRSKALTPTQQRYATVELECLAILWAIHKCSFYLKELHTFTVLTDHIPLEGVFRKD